MFLSRLFRRKKPKIAKPSKVVNQVVVGLIIGGAIGSIIGKKMVDGDDNEKRSEDKND